MGSYPVDFRSVCCPQGGAGHVDERVGGGLLRPTVLPGLIGPAKGMDRGGEVFGVEAGQLPHDLEHAVLGGGQ